MRLCLVPLKTEPRNLELNLHRLRERLIAAAAYHPQLICLPECTLTGYLWEEEDLNTFAEAISGRTTQWMADLARSFGVYLCYGLVEAAPEGFYNTALLLNPRGEILIQYRKICEQPPYRSGREFSSVDTEFGRIGLLICGDLFHEDVLGQLDRNLQLLLVPMSRGFDDTSPNLQRWLNEERQAYLDAVKQTGVTTAIVNALEDLPNEGAFGGAFVVDPSGKLLAESRHGTDELLIIDL
ncbi:MAG: hypothetical protein DDG59_11980 [Anaerolineae bacterium]|jgi:predicted amidohydrolase|nr:MAG: hypothetical protein DDG59_11980 [Anaerolineae bacterium]